MIKEETIVINNKEYIKHTTDMVRLDSEGNQLPCLVQIESGNLFFDTIDEKPCKFHYVEYQEPELVEA